MNKTTRKIKKIHCRVSSNYYDFEILIDDVIRESGLLDAEIFKKSDANKSDDDPLDNIDWNVISTCLNHNVSKGSYISYNQARILTATVYTDKTKEFFKTLTNHIGPKALIALVPIYGTIYKLKTMIEDVSSDIAFLTLNSFSKFDKSLNQTDLYFDADKAVQIDKKKEVLESYKHWLSYYQQNLSVSPVYYDMIINYCD